MRVLTTWLFRGYVFREGEAVSAKTRRMLECLRNSEEARVAWAVREAEEQQR